MTLGNQPLVVASADEAESRRLQQIAWAAGRPAVIHARSGLEVLALLHESAVDAILCGQHLEDVDAWRLAALIRNTWLSRIPVILVSEVCHHPLGRAASREYGCHACFPPDDREGVSARLSTLNASLKEGRDSILKRRGLIIEQRRDTAELMQRVLGPESWNWRWSAGGAYQAWEVEAPPDLMVIDLRSDSIDAIRAIHEVCPDQPIVALRSDSTPDLAIEALAAGAAEFIGKPFSVDVLRDACQRAMRIAGYRRALDINPTF